jgi:hypothetical protein
MRITNLSGKPIVHGGQIGCGTGSARLYFDIATLFPDGEPQEGRAARFTEHFLRASGMRAAWMREVRTGRSDCVGSVGVDERLPSGRSVTVQPVVFARHPWGDQPLPGGKTNVSASYRYSSGSQDHDLRVSAPVRIKGQTIEYPSPQALADAMLAEPEFRDWVESRNERAAFHPNIEAPWNSGRAWEQRGYVGGLAPPDTLSFDLQTGGRSGDYVRDLVIDPWTAVVRKLEIIRYPADVAPEPSEASATE